MVGPCWGGEVYGLIGGAHIEFGEEESTEMVSTGTGYCLEAGNLISVLASSCYLMALADMLVCP